MTSVAIAIGVGPETRVEQDGCGHPQRGLLGTQIASFPRVRRARVGDNVLNGVGVS